MRKFAVLLLLALTLTTLAACAGASDTSLPPYGVDDRFLGCWTTEKEGAYTYQFLPNGVYYKDSPYFSGETGTWYTAESQVLYMNELDSDRYDGDWIYKYTFVDADTFTISWTNRESLGTGDEVSVDIYELTFTRSNEHFADIAY